MIFSESKKQTFTILFQYLELEKKSHKESWTVLYTYVDIDITEADGAVGDEAGVDGVKVGDALHVRDEGRHAAQEDDEDGPDDGRMEALLVLKLLAQIRLDLEASKQGWKSIQN